MQSGDMAELCLDGLPAIKCVACDTVKIAGMFAPAEVRKSRARCSKCNSAACRRYRGGVLGRKGTDWERNTQK